MKGIKEQRWDIGHTYGIRVWRERGEIEKRRIEIEHPSGTEIMAALSNIMPMKRGSTPMYHARASSNPCRHIFSTHNRPYPAPFPLSPSPSIANPQATS